MAFTALDVKNLREKTGCGMMDCKKALTEADGDMDKAIDFLREKGLAAAQKKAGRIAAEGAVVAYIDDAKKVGVLLEVNAETDFVAKNEKFVAFADLCAKTIADKNPADIEALMAIVPDGTDRDLTAQLQELVLQIGENMKVRRFVRMEGNIVSYIHFDKSKGVIANIATDDATAQKDEVKELGHDICLQIAALNPAYLDEASVPADVLDKEKEIMVAQMKEDPKMAGKPEMVLNKIVDGKIGKYFKENCLIEMPFVKDDKMAVKDLIAKTAKDLGADIKVVEFARFEKGEGLQKRDDNFADEVASMM